MSSTTTPNSVLMSCYNSTLEQHELTMEAVMSVLRQDIEGGIELTIIDNGSPLLHTHAALAKCLTDSWYPSKIRLFRNETNLAPTAMVNTELQRLFKFSHYPYVLGVPNDVILPVNFYRELRRWPRGIITASQTDNRNFPTLVSNQVCVIHEQTPLCVALYRRWVYDALVAKDGYFLDEGMVHYASDCDLALRLAACGIRGIQLNIPFFHSSSASWRKATPEIATAITAQADIDRSYFERKWGFHVASPHYGEACGNLNFRG